MEKVKQIILTIFFFFTIPCYACDNTLLTILAGKNVNELNVAKFLAISEKLQKEGDMLTAFNLASAKQIHKEVLQKWLSLVSELGGSPVVKKIYREEYTKFLSEIAKDLGVIRKRLMKEKLDNVHEIIENCVTKISILGAQINEQVTVYNFLKFELLVYEPGNYLDKPDKFIEESILERVYEVLETNEFYIKDKSACDEFLEKLNKHRENINKFKNNELKYDKLAVSYNVLKNSFVLVKQKLLNSGYFN